MLLLKFFQNFLFKFIFLAYECNFISANHTIINIRYLEQTGKKCSHSDEKIFFVLHFRFVFFSKKCKKMKFQGKNLLNIFCDEHFQRVFLTISSYPNFYVLITDSQHSEDLNGTPF